MFVFDFVRTFDGVVANLKKKVLSSAEHPDPNPLDPEHYGFLDPDLQKYADPRIWIQGANYQLKS